MKGVVVEDGRQKAATQLIADGEVRKAGDAEAAFRHVDQRFNDVGPGAFPWAVNGASHPDCVDRGFGAAAFVI